MTGFRTTGLALITATTLLLPGAAASTALAGPTPAPCRAPAGSGFQSCLRVLYIREADGSIRHARVIATLVERAPACGRTAKRRVTISRDGDTLGAERTRGRCRHGVSTWRTVFPARVTKSWDLQQGDVLRSDWTGVQNPAQVTL